MSEIHSAYGHKPSFEFEHTGGMVEPYPHSSTVLRNPMAMCFPACCAFSVIGKFERLGLNLSNRNSKEEFQKRVEELCNLPSERYFGRPPAGSFVTLNSGKRKTLVREWLEDMGFEPVMETIPNFGWSKHPIDVLFRLNPKYKDEMKKGKAVKEVF